MSRIDRIMALRRQIRDSEQEAELLEERATSPLTIEEAAARFRQEAAALRTHVAAQKLLIDSLESCKQTYLF